MCAITELAVCFRFSFRSEGLGISLLQVSFSGAFIVVLDLPADFPESCIWKAISEFPWGIIKRATDTKSSSSSSPWRRDADPQPSTGKSSSSSSNSWVRDEGPQPSTDNWWSSNSRWSDEDPQHALKLPQRQAPPPPKKTEVTLIPSTMHQEPSPEVPNNTIRQPRTPSHSPPRKRAKMQTPQPTLIHCKMGMNRSASVWMAIVAALSSWALAERIVQAIGRAPDVEEAYKMFCCITD